MAFTRFIKRLCALAPLVALAAGLAGCATHAADSRQGTAVFLIESNPLNLDPRIGTDAQSQDIDGLIFNSLVRRNAHMDLVPDLSTSWQTPDPLTYVFHLRHGVRFQNGQAFTSADVKYTFDSILSGAVETPKRGSYAIIRQVDTPDPWTVVFHLRHPYSSFLWDLTSPGIGIVPKPANPAKAVNPAEHPIGTGPFQFVSMTADQNVVLERNPNYFGPEPKIRRIIFRVVPDETTRALELRKGSADIALNSLTPDTVDALARTRTVRVTQEPGTNLAYIAYNCTGPILRHVRVREALAYATNRPEIIRYLLRGQARVAYDLLPPGHWAYNPNIPHYDYNPALANRLLDEAGFPRGPNGIRFHLTLKTSTEETSRQLGAVLQQQWRQVGVVLNLQSLEFGTFYADITNGNFQLYTLRWLGANDDPDFLYYVFDSHEFPPTGANRGRYSNPKLDALLEQARVVSDRQERKKLYAKAQEIIAHDQPYLTLWYVDNVAVHTDRVENVRIDPAGGFGFLTSIVLRDSAGHSGE